LNIELYLNGHEYHFECENLCRVFFPYNPVKKMIGAQISGTEEFAVCAEIEKRDDIFHYKVRVLQGEKQFEKTQESAEHSEYTLTRLLFLLFAEYTNQMPKWGMLTGIHPAKLFREYADEIGQTAAEKLFKEKFFVSEEKLELLKEIAVVQNLFVKAIRENDFCLYVGVPFCPTRCSYCSFVSQSIEKTKKLVQPYFELLLLEIEKTAEVVSRLNLNLKAVYIGGGTPTTFSAEQLQATAEKISKSFDMSNCTEFTVEAGRPDTITQEKLAVLKNSGITRISINPQSLSDAVLKNIGRSHTAAEVEEAFDLAKQAGFGSVNSDLIVGLPGDTLESFKNTLQGVLNFGASNVTVHSLALKRSSRLVESNDAVDSHKDAKLAADMMDYSIEELKRNEFVPYYLYRQSRMAGNLENTGWCKIDDVCAYNIYTMDESMTIIACGAGAVSKIKDPYSNRLERIFNFKHPHEYIERHGEMLKRKEGVETYYEQFRKRLH
jgi:coproporphyrinogen dehydrogenase HemZ